MHLAERLLKLVPTRSAYTGYLGSPSVICQHFVYNVDDCSWCDGLSLSLSVNIFSCRMLCGDYGHNRFVQTGFKFYPKTG